MIEINLSKSIVEKIVIFLLLSCTVFSLSGEVFAGELYQNVEAGLINNHEDAKNKCPKTCLDFRTSWNGNWKHTVTNMSVCGCKVSCDKNEICVNFEISKEYGEATSCNDIQVKGACVKGIPDIALQDYEIVINTDGKAYYKKSNKPFSTWSGQNKETLYVIDASNDKIYFINVDERYIEASTNANCIDNTKVKDGESTRKCVKPRLTTHAGILMESVAKRLSKDGNMPISWEKIKAVIKVKGAGTVKVLNGVIQEITNDSGHFTPTTDDLKHTLVFLKEKKGLNNFPPRENCQYNFKDVQGKENVVKQEKCS